MIALVSAVALAVDVGMLLTARAEAQRAADSGALAGAGWLLIDPNDEAGARTRAEQFAEQNPVRGITPDVIPDQDIDVILDSAKVRVRVHMIDARSLAIPTYFARVFGVDEVDVAVVAAAWAAPVTGVDESGENAECLLPIALPDQWNDTNGNGEYDIGENYTSDGTSIGDYSIGDLIAVKVSGSQITGGPKPCREESAEVDLDLCREIPDSENWRCWWRESPDADGGADVLGARIYPGDGCDLELAVTDQVWTADAGGNKQSLVHTTHEDFGGSCTTVCYDYDGDGINETCEQQCPNGSFSDLIRADSVYLNIKLEWSESLGCPVDMWGNPAECYEGDSYRMRSVPLVAPDLVTGTGSGINTFITDFAGVFVDKVACNYDLPMFEKSGGNQNVYIRIVRFNNPGGSTGGDPGPGPGGTTLKILQLIE
jgi:hypothetical protein